MKKMVRLCLFLFVFAALQVGAAPVALALKPGMPAPAFTLPDLNGHPVSPLAQYRGKVVLLNFWSTTCRACLAEIPTLNAVYSQLKDQGLVVVGVAVDKSPKAVAQQVEKSRIAFPVLVDQEESISFELYGLFGFPTTLLIDRKGNLAGRFMGELKPDSPLVSEKIVPLLHAAR